MNENAVANILADVDFLAGEFTRIGRPHVVDVFSEIRAVRVFFALPWAATNAALS